MAHKTLIGGTAYEVAGGKTLVDGTAYSIAKGRTLVGGTGYDISFISPAVIKNLWSTSGSSYTDGLFCMTYANGYFVAGGMNNGDAYIAYATAPGNSWTKKVLESPSSWAKVNDIAYVNGYWVACVTSRSGNTDTARIYYATKPSGTWTAVDLWSCSGQYGSSANCIAYGDGYWAVGGDYYDGSTYYARIAYASSISGTWTTKDQWSGPGSSLSCITYANNLWAVGGVGWDTSTSGYVTAVVGYAANIYASFMTKNLWTHSSYSSLFMTDIRRIVYENGYWVVSGYASTSVSYSARIEAARIAYATSLSGTWTVKDLWKDAKDTTGACYSSADYICYADGQWIVGGVYFDGTTTYARLAYATSLSGSWTVIPLWSDGATNYADKLVAYANYVGGYWIVGGTYKSSSTYYARIAYGESLESFEEL